MPETFSSDVLTTLVSQQLGEAARSLQFARVTTGKHNTSYWVKSNLGHFILRIAPPDDIGLLFYERLMMRQEPALHQLLQEHTSVPVADIVAYDFDRHLIDRDYVLLEVLSGQPLSEITHFSHTDYDRVLEQVGGYLQQIHRLTADVHIAEGKYGYLGAHRPMVPQPTWGKAFAMMWNALLDDVVACGGYDTVIVDALRDLLVYHQTCFGRSVEPRLLHMDVWSQNILVDAAGNVTGLVDFDRALWGDVEIEFAVLDYCGISEPSFWQGYGSPRDESPAAIIRRQFYLLYEILKYIPISIWRRQDQARADSYKQYAIRLIQPLLNTK
ncbi:MAG: aminoglycoside phosphotransferase family protein [Chloroflexota bacterium]